MSNRRGAMGRGAPSIGGEDMQFSWSDETTNSRRSIASNGTSFGSSPNTNMGSYGARSPSQDYSSSYNNKHSHVYSPGSYPGMSSANDHLQYSNPGETQHATPSSLGWTPDTLLPNLYRFVVIKGQEPYLELLSEWTVTYQTPSKVYLDKPINPQKGVYPCQFPTICLNKYGQPTSCSRPADLDRHYKHVHSSSDSYTSFPCDYPKCLRTTEPFTRKDHWRDHLRDYHKEDLGCAKKEKKEKSKHDTKKPKTQEELQDIWLSERKIRDPEIWRCRKCLSNLHVAKDGWECPACHLACEQDRIDFRKNLARQRQQEKGNDAAAASYGCHYCNGTAWIEDIDGWNQMTPCTNCQPPAQGTYENDNTWGNDTYSLSFQ